MAIESGNAIRLAEHEALSLGELAELTGLPEAYLRELVDYGALTPVDPGARQWVFAATCLTTVRAAGRLYACFELEPHGLALVLTLLDRIDALEAELRGLRARLPRYER